MTVQAADLGGYESFKDAPPPAPRFTWSGVYGGLNAGGGWGKSKVTENGSFFSDAIVGNYASYNANGFIGGLQAGMNRQYGNWVLGGEFNLSGANIDGSSELTVTTTPAARSAPTGWSSHDDATPVRRFDVGHTSRGNRLSTR